MAANYQGFYVNVKSAAGVITAVGASVSVAVRLEGAGSDAAESPLSTDANGYIAAGTIAAASSGDKCFFRVANYNGMAASAAQILTP